MAATSSFDTRAWPTSTSAMGTDREAKPGSQGNPNAGRRHKSNKMFIHLLSWASHSGSEVTPSAFCLICLFFTKGPIAIFSSPTEREQQNSCFLQCKDLLNSFGHKPFLHVVSDFRYEQHWLLCRALPKQSLPLYPRIHLPMQLHSPSCPCWCWPFCSHLLSLIPFCITIYLCLPFSVSERVAKLKHVFSHWWQSLDQFH